MSSLYLDWVEHSNKIEIHSHHMRLCFVHLEQPILFFRLLVFLMKGAIHGVSNIEHLLKLIFLVTYHLRSLPMYWYVYFSEVCFPSDKINFSYIVKVITTNAF